jgi:peptidoglycan/LPS O-acetylase OafA/YrhL
MPFEGAFSDERYRRVDPSGLVSRFASSRGAAWQNLRSKRMRNVELVFGDDGALKVGFLRFYLALSVFVWHCWIVDEKFFLHSFAAVFCFFITSGFLISMALTRAYPATAEGTMRFYLNRSLRLFPTYLAVLVATALDIAAGFVPITSLSSVPGLNSFDPVGLIDQITVLPHVIWRNITLDTDWQKNNLAIGWYYTVGLEMMFYLLSPFFVRWKLPNLILLFVASGILHFVPYMLNLPFRQWQYEFFPSTLVFFVGGALSYRLFLAIKDDANRYAGWLLPIGVSLYGFYFSKPVYTDSFEPITLYVAFALLLPFLFLASENRYIKKVDTFLGDLSYPLYVVHGLAAGLVGGGVGLPTDITYALPVAIALSTLLYLGVEMPMEKFRSRVRKTTSGNSRYVRPRDLPRRTIVGDEAASAGAGAFLHTSAIEDAAVAAPSHHAGRSGWQRRDRV